MEKLYEHELKLHNITASTEIVPFLMEAFQPKSVLDVGCGLGTWLYPFYEHNIKDVIGLDGDYVDMSHFVLPHNCFLSTDLRKPFDLNRKFDLLLSLEVAEHLPATVADDFISSLVRHSEIIVFSAAIPGQGGQNHLNEQPFEYWEEKFKQQGYLMYDFFRYKYWNNKKIEPWYRQNMMLVLKEGVKTDIEPGVFTAFHPELLPRNVNNSNINNKSISTALRFLGGSILRKMGLKH